MSTRSTANPTVRRRELARRLRELRQAAGVSLEDVAKELMCSTAKVSRMETGERAVQARDLRDLCRFYAVSDAERDDLMKLAREAAQRGWWQDYRSLEKPGDTFVGLESAAKEIRLAMSLMMPGLTQTPEYTRALVQRLRPPGDMTLDWVEERVQLRAERQRRISVGDVRFSAVMDEAAFRRMVGSPSVMVAQLDRLIEDAQKEWVTLQVIPFSVGAHPGMEGSFQYLHMGDSDDVVYVEGLLGEFLIEDQPHIERYLRIYDYLSGEVALNRADSLEWMKGEQARWERVEGVRVDEVTSR